jgi:DNA-binding IclR family transcriptional regulator
VPRTQQLLAAIGDPDGFALLDVLRQGPRKQTALAEEASVPAGTASARIEVLVALGLVARPSARGQLSITHPEAFATVIAAADALTGVVLRTELAEHERRTGEGDGNGANDTE